MQTSIATKSSTITKTAGNAWTDQLQIGLDLSDKLLVPIYLLHPPSAPPNAIDQISKALTVSKI